MILADKVYKDVTVLKLFQGGRLGDVGKGLNELEQIVLGGVDS